MWDDKTEEEKGKIVTQALWTCVGIICVSVVLSILTQMGIMEPLN